MINKRMSLSLCLLIFIAVSTSACGKEEENEPTKYSSQAGLEKLTQQAQQKISKNAKQPNTSINPAFYISTNINGKAPEVKDLDSQIKPVLKKIFSDARLISESKTPETKIDGEIVENKFTYIVSKALVPKDGEPLHAALYAAHFGLSPRLGSKPTIWSGGATMSLFKTTSLRSYSLVVNIDTRKQQIVIESYRLGSKYDRLM